MIAEAHEGKPGAPGDVGESSRLEPGSDLDIDLDNSLDTHVDNLCFTARALAQTHPMKEASHRYRQSCIEQERQRQPVSEPADWAGTALMVGYCLRRAEEKAAAVSPREPAGRIETTQIDMISSSLGTDNAHHVVLLPVDVVTAALDKIITTEIDKRYEHMHEQLDTDAWRELEDYITWWVLHGYGLRAAESAPP